MAFVAWAVLCLVLALWLHRRPFALVLLAGAVWVLVPGIAAHHLTALGGMPPLHPAAVLVLVAAPVLLVTRPRWTGRPLADRPEWAVLLVTLSALAVVIGVAAGAGTDSTVAVVNQMVAPALLFLLLGAALLERPERAETVRTAVVVVATLESLLSLAQLAAGRSLVYESDFADLAIVRQGSQRWMGTFDHPLVLSLFLVVALLLLAGVRSTGVLAVVAPVLLGGMLASQSRVGLAFAAIAVCYLLVRGRAPLAARVSALVLLVTTSGVALWLGAADAFLERLRDDQGSSTARGLALQYFLDHAGEFVWFGRGLNSSFSVSEAAGLDTSFESAVLMYSVDLGMLVAFVYFGLMVWVALRPARRAAVIGVAPAAAAVVVIPQTFSALSGTTAAPFVVWFVLALAGFGPLRLERRAVSPSVAVDATRAVRRGPVGVG